MKGKKIKTLCYFSYLLKIMYRKSGDFSGILFSIIFLARFFFKKPSNLLQKTTKFHTQNEKAAGIAKSEVNNIGLKLTS